MCALLLLIAQQKGRQTESLDTTKKCASLRGRVTCRHPGLLCQILVLGIHRMPQILPWILLRPCVVSFTSTIVSLLGKLMGLLLQP